MKRLVIQVLQVDEDVADTVLRRALATIKTIDLISFKDKDISIEPHDDERGIFARVDFSYVSPAAEKSRSASAALHALVQSLIKAQLFQVTHLKVIIETGNTQ